MADKVSTFIIGFDGDAGDIKSVLASLKSDMRTAVSEIEAITKKLDLFGDLEKNTQTAFKALTDAKQKVQDLAAALEVAKKAGAGATDDLQRSLKAAQSELAAATREYNKQVDSLSKLENQLTKAGVDTANLAKEEQRLAEAARQANAALVEQQSKAALTFKTFRDIQPEINQLNAAFISLRDSGKLSFGELSIAQARLQQQVGALRGEVSGLGAAFTQIRGTVLAITAAFAGVTSGVFEAAKNWRDFAQQVAAIDSIADSSKATIDRLATGVRALAINMGVDAVQSARALYEIISSGIPADNALEVLTLATKAAIAGLTDVDTSARAGVAVLNAYGLQISDLGHVYDVLFQTVKDGVVTFPELAKNIGQVLPAAVAAKVPIEQLGAAFVVLTRQGIDAPEAATAINKAILDLSAPAPEAAQKMRELGLSFNGLSGSIEQLAKRQLTIQQLSDIIPDVRAQRAVFALTQNFALLNDEIGAMNQQAAQTQAAYAKLADTPQQQVAKFNAAWKDLSLSLGAFVTGTGGVVISITNLVNSFNALTPATKDAAFQFTALVTIGGLLVILLKQLAIPFNLLVGALTATGEAGAVAATGLTATAVAAGALNVAIAGLLGYKLGEWARDNFAWVRIVGDAIGLSAAALANLAEFGFGKLAAAFTANAKASDEASAAYRRNADDIKTTFWQAVTGATERLRALEERQKTLVVQLSETSKAAVESATKLESFVSKITANVDGQMRGIDQIVSRLQAGLQALGESLKESVSQTQALATSTLTALSDQTQQKLGELDKLKLKELDVIRETSKIYSDESAARLKILNQFRVDAITAFNAEAAARLAIAERTGLDIKRVEQQLSVERKALLEDLIAKHRAAANESLQIWQQHLANVKALDEQRIAVVESVEHKIRELTRETLTVRQQYADKISEIETALSKGRQALIEGDTKAAERYAQEATSLIGGIGKAVTDGNQTVVSAYSAQQTAIGLLRQARDLEVGVIDKKKTAEVSAAEAAKAAYDAQIRQVTDISKELDAVTAKVKAGLELQITAKTDAVIKTIDELDVALSQKAHLLDIKADITKANVEIQRLKDDLEKGITVNVGARTEAIATALREVQEKHPEITLDIQKALGQLDDVKKKAEALSNVHIQIDSNAKEIQAQIDKLKEPTFSTHTITVREVPAGSAAGGFVAPLPGIAAQGFAQGGAVFRSPSWSKVPGAGDGDTVPAALQAGSFVMRKAASQKYGDGIMGQLVRAFAGGGFTSGGSLMSGLAGGLMRGMALSGGSDEVVALRRTSDELFGYLAEVLARNVRVPAPHGELDYAQYLRNVHGLINVSLGQGDVATAQSLYDTIVPLRDSIRVAAEQANLWHVPLVYGTKAVFGENFLLTTEQLKAIADKKASSGGTQYSSSSGAAASSARSGWLGAASALRDNTWPDAGSPGGLSFYGFRAGGSTGDTVPAMLTPGEWVIRPSAVQALSRLFGGGFLPAMNAMELPLAFAHGGPVIGPAQPQALASGGSVGALSLADGGAVGALGGGGDFVVHLSTNEPLSEDYVRRVFFPLVNKIQNRQRN